MLKFVRRLLIALLAVVGSVTAQTWNGASSGTWSNGGNWLPTGAPVNNGTAAIVFGVGGGATSIVDQTWLINSITFNSAASTSFTVTGSALGIGAGGITNNGSAFSGQTFLQTIGANASQTWTAAASSLTFGLSSGTSSSINLNSNTVTFDGAGTTILYDAVVGAGAVSKTGGGTLNFSGSSLNTYAGTTTVTQGSLSLNKTVVDAAIAGNLVIGDSLSPVGSVTVTNSGATVEQIVPTASVTVNASGTWQVGQQSISSLTINGGSVLTNYVSTTSTFSITGALTMNGGSLSSEFSGTLFLATNVNVLGTSQASSISSFGSVNLGGATRILTVARGTATSDLTLSSSVSNGGLVKSGNGILQLSGANSFTGGFTLNAGTVAVGSSTAFGSGTVTLNGGTVSSTGGFTSYTIANPLVLGGDITVSGSIPLIFSGNGTFTASRTISVDPTQVVTFSGPLDDGGSGFGLTKAGTGTMILSGANTFSGPLSVTAGLLKVGGAGAFGNGSASVSAGAALDLNGVTPSSTRVLSLAGAGTSTNGALLNSSATAAAWNGSINLLAPATITSTSASGSLTLGGAITGASLLTIDGSGLTTVTGSLNNGVGGLTKTGTGTLILQAANGYSGLTNLTAGTIRLGNAAALGSTAAGTVVASLTALDLNGQAVGAEPLTLSGIGVSSSGALFNGGATLASFAGPVTLAAAATVKATAADLMLTGPVGGTGTLTVDGAFNTSIVSAISVAGSLTKNGTGILSLSGANSYTGSTLVTVGTLRVLASGVLPAASAVTVSGGATLDLNNVDTGVGTLAGAGSVTLGTANLSVGAANSATTFSGVISGAGSVTKTGTASLTLSGSNNYTGATTINNGILSLGNTAALGPGSGVAVSAGGALDLAGFTPSTSQSLSLSGSGLGSTGALINSSATAATWPNAVTLAAPATIRATSGLLTVSGAIQGPFLLTVDGTSNTTLSGLVNTGSAGLAKVGTGTLLLQTANLYSGPTTVSAGTLKLGDPASLGTTAGNTTVLSGGALDLNGQNVGAEPIVLNGIGPGGGALINAGATPASLSGPIMLGSSATIRTTVGDLGLTGNIGGNAVLSVDGAGTTTLSGAIALNTGGLTKLGTGTLTLGGAAAYTGATTLSAGTLRLSPGGALSPSSALVISAGATLDLNSVNVTSGSLSSSGNVLLGTATLTAGADNGTASFSGTISGNGGLTKVGAGTQSLNAPNYFTGATTVNNGILRLGDNNAIGSSSGANVNSGGTLDLNGLSAVATPVTLNGPGYLAGGALTNSGSAAAALSGRIALAAPSTVFAAGGLSLSGGIVGSFALTVDGPGATSISSGIAIGNASLIKNGSGTLTLNGSQANTSTGPTIVNAGTLYLGSSATAIPGDLSIGDGNGGGGADVVRLGASNQTAPGTNVTLSSSGLLDTGSFSTSVASLTANGGAIAGTGTLSVTGGLFVSGAVAATSLGGVVNVSGQLVNQGSVTLTGSYSAAGGSNLGSLTLSGGTLLTGGAFTNNNLLSGSGTIGGAGSFANAVQVTVAGFLALNAAGSNGNTGNIDLGGGNNLSLGGGQLSNDGTINLNSGAISGSGTLRNGAAGTVTGRGTISAPFSNAGTILVVSGTTSVVQPFASSGDVQLLATTATLSGGAIANSGTIEGLGKISNDLSNSGTVEASGGNLTLAGSVSNSSTGLLAIDAGAKILVTNGLASNQGMISLAGSTFDNNGKAFTNAGQIRGFGTLRSGALTNNGSIILSGGASTINGDVTNSSGRTINIAQSTAAFTGNLVNNGTIETSGATVSFAGTFTNNGAFVSDPSTQRFASLSVSASGYLTGGNGDLYAVAGDLTNRSQQASLWSTTGAEIDLTGAVVHQLTWTGADRGKNPAGFVNNFALGTLLLSPGASLDLLDGDAISGGAIYVHALVLGGGVDQVNSLIANGLSIYYDPSNPANNYLLNGAPAGTYLLANGGVLAPVPEPGIASLLLGSAGVFFGIRRRRAG